CRLAAVLLPGYPPPAAVVLSVSAASAACGQRLGRMHFSPWVDMAVVGETYQARPSRHPENNTQNQEDIMKLTIIPATRPGRRGRARPAGHAAGPARGPRRRAVARTSAKLPAEVLAAGPRVSSPPTSPAQARRRWSPRWPGPEIPPVVPPSGDAPRARCS